MADTASMRRDLGERIAILETQMLAVDGKMSILESGIAGLTLSMQDVSQTQKDIAARDEQGRLEGQALRKRRDDIIISFLKFIALAIGGLLLTAAVAAFQNLSTNYKDHVADVIGVTIALSVGALLLIAWRIGKPADL